MSDKRKNQYETMMERLEREGKVKDVPPEQRAAILESMRKALEEYRASDKHKRFLSEQELWNTKLNN